MEETVVTTGMEAITSAMSTVTEMVSSVFTVMTGNPLLCVFLAAGLLSMGIGIFCKARRASKG